MTPTAFSTPSRTCTTKARHGRAGRGRFHPSFENQAINSDTLSKAVSCFQIPTSQQDSLLSHRLAFFANHFFRQDDGETITLALACDADDEDDIDPVWWVVDEEDGQ